MKVMDSLLERKLESLTLPLAVGLPDGHRIGALDAAITIRLRQLAPLAHIAAGEVGKVAQDYVEGKLDFDGSVRDLMVIAAQMIGTDPTQEEIGSPTLNWWREIRLNARSRARHQVHAEIDPFRDEAVEYALRLLRAGVPTELHVFPGTCHGFDSLLPDWSTSEQLFTLQGQALGRAWYGN